MTGQPNIVLIVTDQHRSDHVGWVDDRFVTPNLDALVARGAVFDRAVVSADQLERAAGRSVLGRSQRRLGSGVVHSDPHGGVARQESLVDRLGREEDFSAEAEPWAHAARRKSKLNDWWYWSGATYFASRSGATHASATITLSLA